MGLSASSASVEDSSSESIEAGGVDNTGFLGVAGHLALLFGAPPVATVLCLDVPLLDSVRRIRRGIGG